MAFLFNRHAVVTSRSFGNILYYRGWSSGMEDSIKSDTNQNNGNTQRNGSSSTQTSDGKAEARIAGILLLLASLISNLTESDDLFVFASVTGLVANLLLYKAAHLEARAQQIAPGVTTFANRLKIIGSSVSVGVTLILLWALLIEVSLKQQGVSFAASTQAGQSGAFLVR
jgi:hypothetical protein